MTDGVQSIPTYLKSLWDIENELRSAAQNVLFLRNAEAMQHLEQARQHFNDALKAITPPSAVQYQPLLPSATTSSLD
jgi:SpoVK/Ycf46/Vps4 family AAA+-type ATPase